MLDELRDKIKNKKLILFGETHGTGEIPKMLSKFFSELAKHEDFNLCLEIPEELQNTEPNKIITRAKEIGTQGLISEEYVKLIKKIPTGVNVFFIAPNTIKNQEDAEIKLSNNILKVLNNKKTFAVMGSVHASKKEIRVHNQKILPAGLLIHKKLKNKLFSVLLTTKTSNNGLKKTKGQFEKGFDHVISF